ncbi:vacuolar protein sorting-associated protein 53 [[Candida] railenensis]|uniref:Vacuolar protein sorting-associated protein 53 n=1 Tax=[Candida] railenensis TaxID=45579 RepID=A0A9P0VYQ9_9ASCO|nr:vacuolar protein sorting-associated protein 53 [[Candida] railenensis]
MSSSLYSRDYSTSHHLSTLFQSPQSLKELPALLNHVYQYKSQLDLDITSDIDAYNAQITSSSSTSPKELSADLKSLFQSISETQKKAIKTENEITAMSENIQKLDKAKKNLVLSMTVLKRLQMLISAIETLTDTVSSSSSSRDYREILQLFSVVKELSSHFKPYKSIDEISTLNGIINRTQAKLIDDIFSDYEDVISGATASLPNDTIQYAGEILELINPSNKTKIIDLFCKRQLHEIQGIFKSSDEAGSLENVNRRYLFYKKILTNVQDNFLTTFPKSWAIELEITKKFCEFTRDDLKSVLNYYRTNNKKSSPDTLLNALTSTLEFERYLNSELSTDIFEQFISRSFEPYLSVWVSQQDSNLDMKFLEYLSASKIPEEFQQSPSSSSPQTVDEFMHIIATNNVPNIATSSAELFRTYRGILSQATKLSSGPILLDLSQLFIKYLKQYASRVLQPCLPTSEADVVNAGVDSIKYLTMVLNTADYCSNTATQLEEKIQATIDEDLKDSINFDEARECFIELITRAITLLLTKISKELEFCWRQFSNINWKGMDQVGDISRYVVDLEKILVHDNIKLILPLVVREGYIRNFCNKVVELIVNCFMNQWKNIKSGISTFNAEQLLLDLETIKQLLLKLPMYADTEATISNKIGAVPASYGKYVNSQTHKAETLLKLLLGTTKPIDDFVLNYINLIGDKSKFNFGKVLELKGIASNSLEYSQFIDNFQLQINTGVMKEELVDSSPILAHLLNEMEEQSATTIQFNNNSSNIRKPVPVGPKIMTAKSPILGGSFSPSVPTSIQNNLKINNIEKSFRELALNGENKVSKINENFKNFGKLFRKNDE